MCVCVCVCVCVDFCMATEKDCYGFENISLNSFLDGGLYWLDSPRKCVSMCASVRSDDYLSCCSSDGFLMTGVKHLIQAC